MKNILMAGIISLFLVGCGNAEQPVSKKDVSIESAAQAVVQEKSKWTYEDVNDGMRNVSIKLAGLDSDNKVNFDFPYDGGSTLTIGLRQQSDSKDDIVMFAISKGQFFCASSNGCDGTIKFGDGELENITLVTTADHDTGILFLQNKQQSKNFIEKLKTNTTLIVELPFFQAGNKQFEFSPRGLEWN